MMEVLPAAILSDLIEIVRNLGGNSDAMLAEVGLPDIRLMSGDEPISHRKLIAFVNHAAEKLKRRDLGLLWGAQTDVMLLGPLGVAMLNAPTPRGAMQMLADFLPSQNSVLSFSITPTERRGLDVVGLVNSMRRPPSLKIVMERNTAFAHQMLVQLCGPRFVARDILFSHSQHADDAAYMRTFGRMPLFEMAVTGVVASQQDLDGPIVARRSDMFDMAVTHLKSKVRAPAGPEDRLRKMAAVLARNFDYSLPDVAGLLGMHERLLQRRLSEVGETFSMLKDRVRRQEAERLLANAGQSLTSIALALGFKDLASFSRACRRWFGVSPSATRKALLKVITDEPPIARTHPVMLAQRLRSRPEGV